MTTIDVLCNLEMTRLLAPLEQSKPVEGYWGTYVGAVYDRAALEAVTEEQAEAALAFWRQADSGCLADLSFGEGRHLRKIGVFGYLEGKGITADRNVAVALGDLASDAGMSWVEFMTWVADNCPTPTQLRAETDARLDALFGVAR
jgi:hypothetical protein